MQNAFVAPRTYEMTVTKIQSNLKNHKKPQSLLLIKNKHNLKA